MSMLAVTFADGLAQPIAESFARRLAQLNEIDAIAIDPINAPLLEDPRWIKAWVWDLIPEDVDCVIWFDPDYIPIGPVVDLFPRHDYPFGAVPAVQDSVTEALRDCAEAKKCLYYFSSGLFFARRVARPLFEEWKSMLEKDPGITEQTALNLVLNRYYKPGDVFFLPPLANWISSFGKAPESVRMLRLDGWIDEEEHTQILRAFARVFDPVVKGISPREETSCAVV